MVYCLPQHFPRLSVILLLAACILQIADQAELKSPEVNTITHAGDQNKIEKLHIQEK